MSFVNVKVITDSGETELSELTELGLQEARYCADRLITEIENALQEKRSRSDD